MQVDNATTNAYYLDNDVEIAPSATNVVIADSKLDSSPELRKQLGYLVNGAKLTVDTAPAGYTLVGTEYKRNATLSGIVKAGKTSLAAGGTAERLNATAGQYVGDYIMLNASPGNTGPIYVGDSSVAAAAASEVGVLVPETEPVRVDVGDPYLLFVNGTTTGDDVQWTVFREKS